MSTFDDLNLGPEVVEALAAEGMETPTPFQTVAMPVIAKGRDLLGRAGPGAGTLVAYGGALLTRLEGGAGSPCCLVLCTGSRQATELARSLSPMAAACGLRTAALTDLWNLPQLADILFVPGDRLNALYDGEVRVDAVQAIVVHDGDGLLRTARRDHLETLFNGLPKEAQRVICGQPFGSELSSFAEGHTRKAVTVPPVPVEGGRTARPKGGRVLELQVVDETREEAALDAVIRLLQDPIRHVHVFAASEDQAADVGDFLSLHGFHCGAPGDESVPVWLAVDDEEQDGSEVEEAVVATLSVSVPPGQESLVHRHGASGPATVIAEVRELGHLRGTAAAAGFELKRVRPPRPARVTGRIDELESKLAELVGSPRLTPYYLLVEALLSRFTAAEIAAACLHQLDEQAGKERQKGPAPSTAWVRLFLTVGERDQVGPGDILGAVTGESGVPGSRVGKIDVRESHSLVEVRQDDAKKVIEALNGTTLGGRALRVDYDRARERKTQPRKGPRRSPARG